MPTYGDIDDHRQFEPDALEDGQGNQGWIPVASLYGRDKCSSVFYYIYLYIIYY